jgi:hypothetical protein
MWNYALSYRFMHLPLLPLLVLLFLFAMVLIG